MTGTQYRETRNQMGLLQTQLAKLLGLSRSAIIRREASAEVSKEAEMAIMAVKANEGPKGGGK